MGYSYVDYALILATTFFGEDFCHRDGGCQKRKSTPIIPPMHHTDIYTFRVVQKACKYIGVPSRVCPQPT